VIFSTHLMDNAERLCDAVCIIAKGQKVLDGAVALLDSVAGVEPLHMGIGPVPAVKKLLGRLGLTLAQTFVQQHQGTIECESEPGRTLFKILIPLP